MRHLPLLCLVLAATLAAASPAIALCAACNATIRLDSGLSACFASKADAALKALADSGKSMLMVDLNDCGTRGSLPTANPSDDPPAPLDLRFAVDPGGIRCLTALIGSMDDSELTPSHLFDLTKDCPAQ